MKSSFSRRLAFSIAFAVPSMVVSGLAVAAPNGANAPAPAAPKHDKKIDARRAPKESPRATAAPKADAKKEDAKKDEGKKAEGKKGEAKKDEAAKPATKTAANAPKPTSAPLNAPKPPCTKAPVDVVSGADNAHFVLTQCDGAPAPTAVEQLSILARPGSVPRPTLALTELAKQHGPQVSPGIKRVDPGLVTRLQRAVDHFAKDGHIARILIVSGYRPTSAGSYHQAAKALDFRLEGVTNEALVAFCKTMDDTGCGYYPNSVFIHMDVRTGAGHVTWIDASGPGESPRYVTTWPPRPGTTPPTDKAHAKSSALMKLDREMPPFTSHDEHPAEAPSSRRADPDDEPALPFGWP